MASQQHRDVIVIGAGISGLVAANELVQAGKTVLLMDARERVGGKTELVATEQGAFVEGGAQFVKRGHTEAQRLIAEAGLPLVTIDVQGDDVYLENGVVSHEAAPFSSAPDRHEAYTELMREFEALAFSAPVGALTQSDRAVELDCITVADWAARSAADAGVRARFVRDVTSGMGNTDRNDVSLLAALHYLNAAGAADSGHEAFLPGGFTGLTEHLAKGLDCDVLLGTRVTDIAQTSSGMLVTHTAGESRATDVVIACSPTLMRNINVQGLTWPTRDRWQQELSIKATLRYATPFWEQAGLSGNASGDLDVSYVINTSTPGFYQLTALWNKGQHDLTPLEVREKVLADVAAYLGDAALTLSDLSISDWTRDALAGGCGSPLGVGVLSDPDAFRIELAPHLFRAGTEASSQGWGSVEGAVRAGKRGAYALLTGSSSIIS